VYARKRIPESLRGYGKKQYIHPLDKLRIRKVGSHCTDRAGKAMVLKILWVFVVLIEILNDALHTRPHKDFMVRISKVVRETGPKISCAEY
jgi:hypothetical protein